MEDDACMEWVRHTERHIQLVMCSGLVGYNVFTDGFSFAC
jgi:hypothetical protein